MEPIVALLLLAASATTPNQPDKPNLFPVAISFAAPPTLEFCKSIEPDQAANYDRELNNWHLRNDVAIERLKLVLAKQIEADGVSTLEHLRNDALATVEAFKLNPIEKQKPACLKMYLYVGNN